MTFFVGLRQIMAFAPPNLFTLTYRPSKPLLCPPKDPGASITMPTKYFKKFREVGLFHRYSKLLLGDSLGGLWPQVSVQAGILLI